MSSIIFLDILVYTGIIHNMEKIHYNFDVVQDSDASHNCYNERKMWLAVIVQAYSDIINGTKKERASAGHWFLDESNHTDRKIVCQLAGLQVAHAQRLAKKLLEEHNERP